MKPNQNKGHYAVVFAEQATGHVLKTDLSLYLKGKDEDIYIYFEEVERAKRYVKEKVDDNKRIEGIVYNTANDLPVFIYDGRERA